ncbi:MAG: hypothetical protein DWQ31_20205 [Planctomycetota bacterium]|nr:MAG: hypothetical protein DWQ31_20205 [Planctomycetota bacterium]REJ96458.1 MAG: hypothetical protein DWQ35_04490 [Planctomycetota bacterium]
MKPSNTPSSDRLTTLLYVTATVGAALLAVGAFVAPDRIWSNLLVASYYLVTLSLGALLFIALAYVSGAGWSVAFRRVPEAMASLLPVTGLAVVAVVAVRLKDYAWHPRGPHSGDNFWFKDWWLEPRWILTRAIVCVLLWIVFAKLIVGISRYAGPHSGTRSLTSNVRLSAVFLVVVGLSFSCVSIDWLMALEPMWFSTMWAVYQFSGMVMATLAAIVVLCLMLRQQGALKGIFTDDHLHDLGKLLLGFSCFWMYIWFSQYMLIWYSNIPEETSWFITRTHGPWLPVFVANIIVNWAVPFLVLLPRPAKRNPGVMMKVAVLILVARWIDLYLVVFPKTVGSTPVFGLWEIAAITCGIGLFGLLFFRQFDSASSVPSSDPYLNESLHHHC